jgi:hypothetical protein
MRGTIPEAINKRTKTEAKLERRHEEVGKKEVAEVVGDKCGLKSR